MQKSGSQNNGSENRFRSGFFRPPPRPVLRFVPGRALFRTPPPPPPHAVRTRVDLVEVENPLLTEVVQKVGRAERGLGGRGVGGGRRQGISGGGLVWEGVDGWNKRRLMGEAGDSGCPEAENTHTLSGHKLFEADGDKGEGFHKRKKGCGLWDGSLPIPGGC